MVANYRCADIKKEAIELIKEDKTTLLRDSQQKAVEDFRDQCKDLLGKAVEYYSGEACSYKM